MSYTTHQQSTIFTSIFQGVLSDALFNKFAVDLPKADKSSLVHLPQLFLALQYHTCTIFEDKHEYQLGSSIAVVNPFCEADVKDFNEPTPKIALTYSGHTGKIEALGEALLGADMWSEACHTLRLRLSLQIMSWPGSLAPRRSATISSTTYKLALGLFGQKQYKAAASLLRSQLTNGPKFTALAGRFMTLLMCAQFRSNDIKGALNTFDAAQVAYTYALGAHHPIHSLHICVLADLYHDAKCNKQAVAMLAMAHDISRRTLGENHLATASYASKLAALFVENGLYARAADVLEQALQVYQHALIRGAKVERDASECFYTLAVACKHAGELEQAVEYATRSMEMAASVYTTHLPPSVVSCLLLLSGLLVKRNEMDTAVDLFQDAWAAVKHRPADYASVGSVFALLSCKILAGLMSAVPLTTRSLLETISDEVYEEKRHGVHVPGAWDAACEVVFSAMWLCRPREYFNCVIEGMQHHEIEDDGIV